MSFQLYFLFLITLLCNIPNINTKASPDIFKTNETVKFLISSSTGMQFQKIANSEGSINLIYDCSLGIYNEGIIDVYDSFHPKNTKSIGIQNCENIKLRICPNDVKENEMRFNLKELLVQNINTLAFFTGCKNSKSDYIRDHYYDSEEYNPYYHTRNTYTDTNIFWGFVKNTKRFYINNVENLELLENSCKYFPNVALSIENTTIGKLYEKAISSGVAALQLQNVNIQTFEQNGIYLNYDHENYDPILIIKDCHFGTVDGKTIFVNGSKVEILNNSFQYLEDNVFTVNATKTFSFSDNYIRKMEAPFDVRSSNIHITGNSFDIIKKPWLTGLRVIRGPENRVFNVSQNSMKIYPQHYFVMDPASRPDVITFHDNNFNCSCQYWNFNEFENSEISAYLLQKTSNNVCANLGNCPLWRALRHMDEICDDTFNCSEAQKPKLSTETYLQMILSTLKSVDAKLDLLTSHYATSTITNETVEESNTVASF